MSLIDFDNPHTDKNTWHSYLPVYNKLLHTIKNIAKNVLEVGIGDWSEKNGGSLLIWRKYFTNAKIYGIDILPIDRVLDELVEDKKVKLFCETDAYKNKFINENLSNVKFDLLLDDGPHSLESQENFVELYSPLLSEKGILIVEDVQDMKWIEKLKNKTPEHLKKYIKIYDLRSNKDRYDDIIFTIDRIVR